MFLSHSLAFLLLLLFFAYLCLTFSVRLLENSLALDFLSSMHHSILGFPSGSSFLKTIHTYATFLPPTFSCMFPSNNPPQVKAKDVLIKIDGDEIRDSVYIWSIGSIHSAIEFVQSFVYLSLSICLFKVTVFCNSYQLFSNTLDYPWSFDSSLSLTSLSIPSYVLVDSILSLNLNHHFTLFVVAPFAVSFCSW